jgi:hypothetical protein
MKDKENTTFNVKGTLCTLVVSQDDDGDCIKLWHDLVNVNTNEVVATLGWSPYSCPTDAEVQQLIDLGLPDGLRWANFDPYSGFNFDSEMLAKYLAGYEGVNGGKMELTFRKRPALAA